MARRNCYRCPKNMAHQCNLVFGLDGCPPCADIAESAPSAFTNSDYTAAFEDILMHWLQSRDIYPNKWEVYELASRLNSAKAPNCA